MRRRAARLLVYPLPRGFLWFLVVVNLVGAIFGYNWYVGQLLELPLYTWLVVFDSPLAVTGVALALLLRLRGRILPWLEWWSSLAVIKYGAWAALFWIASWFTGIPITAFDFFGLFVTHVGMVLQGLLLLRQAPPLPPSTALLVLGWFFLNDYFDYAYLLHPTIHAHLFVWCAVTALLLSLLLVVLYRQRRRELSRRK